MKQWIAIYGTALSDFEETLLKFEDEFAESGEEAEVQLSSGKFSVKMRIDTHIPQYLPMFGRKVKVHYRGIDKQCTHCYGFGHYRNDCDGERRTWIEYVSDFMDCNEIEESLYGNWVRRVEEWKTRNDKPDTQTDESNALELSSQINELSLAHEMNAPKSAPTSAQMEAPKLGMTRKSKSKKSAK